MTTPDYGGFTAGNNTSAPQLTTGASRPAKDLAYGVLTGNNKSAPDYGRFTPGQSDVTPDSSRPDKVLAYGEQNVRPSAKLKPLKALRARTKSPPTASKTFGLRPN